MFLNVKIWDKEVCPRPFLTICVTVVFRASGGRCHADSGVPSEGPPNEEAKQAQPCRRRLHGADHHRNLQLRRERHAGRQQRFPQRSGSPVGSLSGSPAVTASSVPTTAPPPQTTAPAAPTTAAPPPQTTAPAAVPSTPSGCYPLTNGGNCYEPGEFCRKSDHGASGVAGDGKRIICEDNDGWRWEPV